MQELRNESKESYQQLPLFPSSDESSTMGTCGSWLDLSYNWDSLDNMVLRSFAGFVRSCNCLGCQAARVIFRFG